MAKEQDVGKGDPLPEDAIQDYLPSETPKKALGDHNTVDFEQTSGNVEEDISAPNIHYGSRLEGQRFQATEESDTARPHSDIGETASAEPPPTFGKLQNGVLQAGGDRDAYFVTEGAPSEYQILHIPSGKHVALSGLDYVQFSDMTVHGDFLARTNPDLQRPTSQDQTEFLLQAEEPAVNDAPVAGNVDLGASPEDTALTITEAQLLAASSDVDGDGLSVTALSVDPSAGTVTDNADGTWTFTPAADLNVDDLAFAFTVSDGSTTDSATATLDVTAVNDAPVAGDDNFTGQEDQTLTIDVADLLSNDSDIDGDTLTLQSFTQPSNGTLVDNGDGTLSFTPDADWYGTTAFDYVVSDGQGGTDTGTASIDIADVAEPPANSDPDAQDHSFMVAEDGSITFSEADLLAGASDPDGDTLSVANVAGGNDGALTDNGDGTWTFTPDTDFTGQVDLTYDLSDGQGGSDTAAITLNVAETHDDPNITPDTTGTSGDDNINGDNGGDDVIDGGAGDDHLKGMKGDDTLFGNSGDDHLQGGHGSDTLYGGTGNDFIQGQQDDDVAYGGSGDDTIDGGEGADTLYGDFGNDTIDGGSGNDVLVGGAGDDILQGGGGDDTFTFDLSQGLGNDTIDGGTGSDSIDLTNAGDWTITFDDGTQFDSNDDPDTAVFSDDSGTIDFDNGEAATFDSVESFNW